MLGLDLLETPSARKWFAGFLREKVRAMLTVRAATLWAEPAAASLLGASTSRLAPPVGRTRPIAARIAGNERGLRSRQLDRYRFC